jgi:hypothetical protein
VSKGARFWGFWCSRVRGVLGGISSIPFDLASSGGQNLGYGLPMRCSYYPQSLAQIRGAIQEIRSWILGSSPMGAVHPESAGHTSLTGASHRSDRYRPQLGFCSGERLGKFAVVPVWLLLQVWVSLELGRSVWCLGAFWLEPV